MELARRSGDVEIVCVDSMTVYRDMDIGTAKPTALDRAAVAHHLLDLADPSEEFTLRRFQVAAFEACEDIEARARRPLLVGGTGLYLRAVVDHLAIPPRFSEVARHLGEVAAEPGGPEALYARLVRLDPVAASRMDPVNLRRVVRALEVTIGSGRPFSSFGPGLRAYPPSEVTMVGLPFDPGTVDQRIKERFTRWLDAGLLTEVRSLAQRRGPLGLSKTARQAIGYKELLAHVEDDVALESCVEAAVRRTRGFARRQWSWFRRDPRIRWVATHEDPRDVLEAALEGRLEDARHAAATSGASGDHRVGD